MATSTAIPDEIEQFTRLAEKWWDTDGEFRPLHQLNPTRLGYIRDRVSGHFGRDPLGDKPLKGLKVIDVGCGGGLLCEPMCRLGAQVTGIDAGEETVVAARRPAEVPGRASGFRQGRPAGRRHERQRYDGVLNMEVVEHVAERGLFLETSAKLLKPGGAMVLSTLNRTLKSLALAKIGAEYVLRWVPAGTHDWRMFVRPSELARDLEPHGMTVEDLSGMSYNPVNGKWLLSRDLDVNYLMFATKAGT
ncbi:MAG: bifunctional 2-polyprenyl-6-hydroxyphenol methylase/3-demethylubiquinol 3-O-methyltransferase UbiG [Magnetovibrio sp.]|nr:bifunctional 2-polyprenyl-6-hydroxyphenol methylase/3-demethylubiquinol 3-O-methyltransferase UbiG [Magnetovibrio sp.]